MHYAAYKWFSWGVASLLKGKSQGLCLVQLCAKYRLVNATSSPYRKIKEAASLKVKVHCTAASGLCVCPLEVGCLIDI